MSDGRAMAGAGRSEVPSRPSISPLVMLLAVTAIGGLIAGILLQPRNAFAGLLIAGLWGFSLAVGTGLFVAVQRVSGAKWWLNVESASSSIIRVFPVAATLLIVALVGGVSVLYPWANHETVSHLVHGKMAWLNVPFFLGRGLIVLALFFLLTRGVARSPRSLSGGQAAGYIVVFALLISVAFWDWVMSLEPEWFSTMFGVYGFANAFLGGLGAVTALTLSVPHLNARVSDDQVHDLGKLLFGFSMFWAYIWFCQYMLIWYAGVPEETGYYAHRLQGGWGLLFWLNPVVSFVLPFVLLLSAQVKRHRPTLRQVALLIVAGRWLDIYVLVSPSIESEPELPHQALAATLLLGIAVFWIWRRLPEGKVTS